MGGLGGLPGVIMITAATVLLALVSFNVPLLKSLYFFEANFSNGEYAGRLRLGALGYCLSTGGKETCVGPKIGYNLDLNTLFNIKTFNIPSSISKWMTYTLILHVVALAIGGVGVLVGLLDLIPGFNMICFPTCIAGICGTVSLIALIFDLAMFFLLKASVNRVSGASGTVGMCVWMTLAAWLLACFAGCAYGLGRCCCDCGGGGGRRERKRDIERDRDLDDYRRRDEDLRLTAIQNEHRRQTEQGLPAFPEMERMPLTNRTEDKYLYDDEADHIPSVGAGYGRRDNAAPLHNSQQYDYNYSYGVAGHEYDPSITTAGAAGVGAGGAGVAATGHQYGSYDNYGGYDAHGAHGGYQDPYAAPQHVPQQQPNNYDSYYTQPYNSNTYNPEYANPTYPPQAAVPGPIGVAAGATAGAALGAGTARSYDNYRTSPANTTTNYTTTSSESAYPEAPVLHHGEYPPQQQGYDQDDGLGAIGRAVTSPTEAQYPATRTATYVSHVSSDSAYSTTRESRQPVMSPPATAPLQPRPQHLRTHNPADQLLASPLSDYPSELATTGESPERSPHDMPPSYGHATSAPRVTEKGRPV